MNSSYSQSIPLISITVTQNRFGEKMGYFSLQLTAHHEGKSGREFGVRNSLLLRGGTAHRALGRPPTSNVNQEKASQTCPWASLVKTIFN